MKVTKSLEMQEDKSIIRVKKTLWNITKIISAGRIVAQNAFI